MYVNKKQYRHINRSLFWKNLTPACSAGKGNCGVLGDKQLKNAILSNRRCFYQAVYRNTAAAAAQGSGCGWLVRSRVVSISMNNPPHVP